MKIKTNYTFPEQYRLEAEDYISYKHSLGFVFGYDDQKKCDQLLRYLYINSPTNSVTELTKNLVDGYLKQFSNSRPRTIHANQSYIRQYGLFLKQRGYESYIYPATLIQCPKDFTPYIFSKEEIYQILKCADNIGPNKNKYVNTPHIYPAILRVLYACGSRIGETVQLKTAILIFLQALCYKALTVLPKYQLSSYFFLPFFESAGTAYFSRSEEYIGRCPQQFIDLNYTFIACKNKKRIKYKQSKALTH